MIGAIDLLHVMLAVILAGLLFMLHCKDIRHEQERKDLYTRLMAKNLSDYDASTDKETPGKGRNFVKSGIDKSLEACSSNGYRGER